ncbi:NAD(P)/FAD-dependent oxidoreductase [Hazenella coriacea]|uniref:2-polyprenyl-6-methoxyphenol hydroxylase-like FAD-dependent oxidoreductase n=1 Tax=Hazenella coriacea TaxID=1179467 RepID=A0A4R3LA20_9BACL|nr:NAD(P)/FAD-dependent oxidoreductase [Hazenella coriacea]TCS96673.1 2-polyprenyl-6-methoxyphenol hydroxylase-like FAD-dependent oxidoreductase [Hazenella coriacea]
MKTDYDVIIVGSRCAGSTLAIELGAAGYDVLLLDQATFPSDTLSTHAFFNNTVHTLKELGVWPYLEQIEAPEVRQVRFQFEDIKIEGELPVVHHEERSFCIHRKHFDLAMFQRANSFETVTSLEGFRVRKLLKNGEQVFGVEGVDRSGKEMKFQASLVVGADGRLSKIRRELALQPKREVPTDFAFFYGYLTHFKQEPPTKFEVFRIYDRTLVIFPTADDQYVVFTAFPLTNKAWLDAFIQDPSDAYFRFLQTQFQEISFQHRIEEAKLVGKVKGLTGFNNHWYSGMGKGWALAGDSMVFKDPALAQGIHDAILEARSLAEVLKKHENWDQHWDEMKEEYESRVEKSILDRFELGLVLTKNQLMTSEQKFIQQVISTHPEAIKKFLGVYNYANSIDELNQTVANILKSMES